MAASELELLQDQRRANSVRLQTLVIFRWWAIAGQSAAVIIAIFVYGLQLQLAAVVTMIGLAVLANVVTSATNPETRRLSDREALLLLGFDTLQLGALILLTGGLNNPFAALMLVPVTIAATVLRLQLTLVLAVITVMLIGLAAIWHEPLLSASGEAITMPPLLRMGFLVSLIIGTVFLAVYARLVSRELQVLSEALVATQLALAREQKLTDLGGVVAAAAHELGTPLATIKLVSTELAEELASNAEHAEDARLIAAQADRCRDILRSMGRAGKEDLQLLRAPLETVVKEAAEPHLNRGKNLLFAVGPEDMGDIGHQPVIQRAPEVIHGLRNLIQNATDFARSTVEIEATWSEKKIIVRIEDDGPGFPESVMPRIGDPFVRRRRLAEDRSSRPGYEGMGLGLFIAKTLLERSGARLSFANGSQVNDLGGAGAIVIVEWPREALVTAGADTGEGLGVNRPLDRALDATARGRG
jgi:two-component system, sensor histidine kinase RegB